MSANFDYEGARAAGYSDDEIKEHLGNQPKYKPTNQKGFGNFFSNIMNNMSNFSGNFTNPTGRQDQEESPIDKIDQRLLKHSPNFDVQGALEARYSPDEINDYLEESKPKRSMLEKGGRLAGQLGLGMAEMELLPYELGVSPLSSKEAQQVPYRENLMEDIERLSEQKQTGVWDEQDQALLDNLTEQLKDPSKSDEFIKTADLGVRGLMESATGLDLHPEGSLEKAANFLGFIKDPKKLINVARVGLKPKQLLKSLIPGTEEARAASVGFLLQAAEEGNLGPVGSMGAIIAGEVIGHAPKGAKYVVQNPKKAAAQAVNLFTGANSSKAWTKQLIEDAKELGIQLDAGSLTNSDLIKLAQARAVQSGLVGKELKEFQKNLSEQIMSAYGDATSHLGELRFENNFQAAEAIKEALKVSEVNLGVVREPTGTPRSLAGRIAVEERPNYQQELLNRIAPQEFESSAQAGQNLKTAAEDIKAPIKEDFNQRFTEFKEQVAEIPAGPQVQLADTLNEFVRGNEGSLLLGESAAEARVLNAARELRDRLRAEGGYLGVTLDELMKTKTTLGDVANYEFGGSNFESAYKKLVSDIDEAIYRTLEEVNPELAAASRELNAEYSAFKDMFENKNVMPLFEPKNDNYNAMLNSFITNPDKLRSLEDIFYNSPRGQELINQVKRDFAEKIISRPNITPREIRDLSNVLGENFAEDIQRFIQQRDHALANPLPRARQGHPLELRAQVPPTSGGKPLQGRAKESAITKRKRMYEFLKDKESDQILKMMDSIGNIKKLRSALELTPEGKKLFQELSRYKLMKMIDNKMTNNITEQVKLGTFSNLLKTKEELAIARELLGKESFDKLVKLQKVSGKMASSAQKFLNASQSGTAATDIAAVSALTLGVITGNPFLVAKVGAGIWGMKMVSKLLADPTFLKHLEAAIKEENPVKLMEIFKKMNINYQSALKEINHQDLQE
jgi:hypothetical protein